MSILYKKIISGITAIVCLSSAALSSMQVFAESVSKSDSLLTYDLRSDGTAVITGCDPSVTWVDLSQAVDGHLVYSIGASAFSGCDSLKYVYLGENISSIGEKAFAGTPVETMIIPPSVREIGSNAFSECSSLQTVCVYLYHGSAQTYNDAIFDGCNENLSVYCPTGSGMAAYCIDHDIPVKQSEKYWFGEKLKSVLNKSDEDKLSQKKTDAAADSTDKAKGSAATDTASSGGSPSGNGSDGSDGQGKSSNSNGSGNSGTSGNTSNNNADDQSAGSQSDTTAQDRPTTPSTDFDDSGAATLAEGEVSGGTGDVPVDAAGVTLEEKYATLPPVILDTYTGQPTVYSATYGPKTIKGSPLEGGSFPYSWYSYRDGYVFEPSGMTISEDDYIILCNCVALEYGADWVPVWEMALVAEVIFNKWHRGDADTIRNVITAPGQFEHSDWYSGLDTFSNRVNNRVIDAVNLYLSYPGYFGEGYTSFRGDGTWNYFW